MEEELQHLIEEMRESIGHDDCWNEATEHWSDRIEELLRMELGRVLNEVPNHQ